MRDEEAAAFARYVVNWIAGEIDRAVLEAQLVVAPASVSVERARANLLEVQRALFTVERVLVGVITEETTGEALAERFCVQLGMSMLALCEWQALEVAGPRGQA